MMNVFTVDANPITAARQLHDKHVCKMPTESAQILSTVLLRAGQKAPYQKAKPETHPAILWAEKSFQNFEWVLEHGFELCREYEKRYEKEHNALEVLKKIQSSAYRPPYQNSFSFGQFIPEKYYSASPVDGYQAYYANEKIAVARYSWPSEPPIWLWEKLLPTYPREVGKIIGDKMKISDIFWADLFSYLENESKKKIKEISLNFLFVHFGFGLVSDLLPQREPGKILTEVEKKFYRFQFLIAYLCDRELLPNWSLVAGKNNRIVHKKKKW